MVGLAFVRIALGAFAWLAPRLFNRVFAIPRADDSAALIMIARGELSGLTPVYALAITGGATAVDLAVVAEASGGD